MRKENDSVLIYWGKETFPGSATEAYPTGRVKNKKFVKNAVQLASD